MVFMKFLCTSILTLSCLVCLGQNHNTNIDTSNYYSYFRSVGASGNRATTNWVDKEEAIPIILAELKKNNFEDVGSNILYELDSGRIIILSVFSLKSNFGILYIPCHFFPINSKDRGKGCYGNFQHVQRTFTYDGKVRVTKIKSLPNNIYTLAENSYWYQYTSEKKDDEDLITKEIAIHLLKQDIAGIIKKVHEQIKK